MQLVVIWNYCVSFGIMKANSASRPQLRSGCPINLTLELLGDRWSLIVIRDIMFGNRRHFRQLLENSEEGIASNILADRLQKLTEKGLISKIPDPAHKQKAIYSLNETAIQLVPLIAEMGAWGTQHLPVSHELSVRATLLADGGRNMWNDFMNELRTLHLGTPMNGPSVFQALQQAYMKAMEAHKMAG